MTGPGAAGELDVERSGGFGGLVVRGRVPLATLTDDQRSAVEALFLRPPGPPAGPDRFVYVLRMDGRQAVVQEGRVPRELQPLLERLSGTWERKDL
jgi:hypothetical protein